MTLLKFVKLRLIRLTERLGLGKDAAHASGHFVVELRFNHDPFPALGLDLRRFRRELLAHKAVEQRRIGEEPAAFLVEQVAGDSTTRRLIGFGSDERRTAIVGRYLTFGKRPAGSRCGCGGTEAIRSKLVLVVHGRR